MQYLHLTFINHIEKNERRKKKRIIEAYIVGCRGASQLGGSLAGIPPGYKANKL